MPIDLHGDECGSARFEGPVVGGDLRARGLMAAVFADAEEKAPGLLGTFDQADMPFHTTDTIDLVIILKGELILDLGADEQRKVTTGDVIIQNGTRHAWHNPGDQPAVMAAISFGATRT